MGYSFLRLVVEVYRQTLVELLPAGKFVETGIHQVRNITDRLLGRILFVFSPIHYVLYFLSMVI